MRVLMHYYMQCYCCAVKIVNFLLGLVFSLLSREQDLWVCSSECASTIYRTVPGVEYMIWFTNFSLVLLVFLLMVSYGSVTCGGVYQRLVDTWNILCSFSPDYQPLDSTNCRG